MTFGVPVTGPTGKRGILMPNSIDEYVTYVGIQVARTPEKLTKFLEIQEWINTDLDNFQYTYYGQRGVVWDYNAAGMPTPILQDYGVSEQGGRQIVMRMQRDSLNAADNPHRVRFNEEQGLYRNGLQTKLILPLPSDIIYKTELDKIENEVYIDIITGQRPISYFDEFVAQWRRSGGDILTREANAWYNTVK
jgi:putative aldouronate transport system substrate-binding protein